MLRDLWLWLANLPLAQEFRDWEDGFPTMESIHLAGLAIFFGAICLLDLRVLGLAPRLPIAAMKRLCLPLTWTGFALLSASGVVLFVVAADQYMRTWSFPIKLALIAAGGGNALYFHFAGARQDASDPHHAAAAARLSAALSIAIWLAAIVAGRWAGYERHP